VVAAFDGSMTGLLEGFKPASLQFFAPGIFAATDRLAQSSR